MSEDPKPPRLRLRERKGFVPVVILVFLVGLVTLFSRLSGRPPVIESIRPTVGYPGEVMIITGRMFHDLRGSGEVRIGAVSPHTDDYIEWTDSSIKLRIPDGTPSDMVTVRTQDGRSNSVFFTNRALIPRKVSGPAGPGEPYIYSIAPAKAPQGGLVTIAGLNFGQATADSGVYFSWGSSEAAGASEPADTWVAASEQDGDYEGWTELEIRVRVPDGTTSGGVVVATSRGRSNAVYFELEGGVGTKRYLERRKYDLSYGVRISGVKLDSAVERANQLLVWVPTVLALPEQRDRELVSRVPADPLVEDYGGLTGFLFQDLDEGAQAAVDLQYLFDRYAVATNVNPDRIGLAYDRSRSLFRRYTAPDSYVPSGDPGIVALSGQIVAANKNPYWKARLIYNYVLQRLSWEPEFTGNAIAANQERKGDALGYASLFVALCRAAEIPSRLVAGYLIDKAEQGYRVTRHVWAEFYLERLGWLPVDPVLGKGVRLIGPVGAGSLGDYYFGNLDNRHITLAKGEVAVPAQTARSRTVQRTRIGGLQTVHEEASGNLAGYTADWLDVEPRGIY